jgi:thiol peroxidase
MVEAALLARAVFVVDKNGIVQHVEYVNEVATEPDYNKALAVAKELA